MGKHSQKTKEPQRHVLVEKVPVLAAIIIAGAGVFVSVMQAISSGFLGYQHPYDCRPPMIFNLLITLILTRLNVEKAVEDLKK